MSRSQAERGRAVLSAGVLFFRWGALAWMTALALTVDGGFRRPELAWAGIGAAGVWTAWLSAPRREPSRKALWFETALAVGLVVISGTVMPQGSVEGGRPFYATAWPTSAVLAWAVARGPWAGLGAGLAIGGGLFASRLANGIPLGGIAVQSLVNGTTTFVLAGAAGGYVARLLERSARELHEAQEQSTRARERAARLEERETLARQIHDSVLQSLAMVHKRGKELAASPSVPGEEVGRLAETAGSQEAALRALILRGPEEAPGGSASLRDALEAVAREVDGLPVQVSSVGPIWMPARAVRELADATRQALENVVEHAGATGATVFAEAEDGWVTVSVRDDGVGFAYEPERLRAEGKAGMLKSMKGRIEALGGRMAVESAPGAGTEIEFRVPV